MARKRNTPRDKQSDLPAPVDRPQSPLPQGYDTFLRDLKERVRNSQIKAALVVSRELIELYWHIGQQIVERQEREGWGAGVIDRLAHDLQTAFPGVQGFSPSNIWRMRAFYLAYTQQVLILAQAVRELDGHHLPEVFGGIPWGHNVLLVEKLKDPLQRLWYAHKTIEHGWSRAILDHQIDSGLYRRQGKAVTNFTRTLPPPQSDLAQQVLKDQPFQHEAI
jgi:predicted nuclease of restriction endonuclease-like (RecB) superfamily